MLHGVPWLLLGSLWAILFSEYRAFRARMKLGIYIRRLEAEAAVRAQELFESEQAYRNVRLELLSLLEPPQGSRYKREEVRSGAKPALRLAYSGPAHSTRQPQ